MAENIEIPKTPMSRTEQYLTKIVKELSGSKEDVEIPKAALSRVEYYLQAIVNLLAEVALGETFTADEKKKLASITNPINVQGTCTQEELDSKKETAQVGDMWFVKDDETGEDSKTKEYVFTKDKQFDLVGDNSINLTNYVQKDDVASTTGAGLILADDPKQSGLTIDEDGKISIYHPEANDLENVSNSHTALTLDRVQPVMSYYGLEDKDTLKDDYVKQTQIATSNSSAEGHVGLVNLTDANLSGITTEASNMQGKLALAVCADTVVEKEQEMRIALHPNNIPMFMHNWGLSDKKWCHEIKKKTSNNVTTDGNGTILPAVSEIVLAAYASTKILERSVCLIPIYGSGGTYTSFLAIDYVTGERLKKTPIGDVTFYYITDTTTAEQTNPSSPESEEPSIDHQSRHTPFHTEVETTETVDPLETEDIQDGEIDG